MVDTGNVDSQIDYDVTRESLNEPGTAAFPMYLTPGDVNVPGDPTVAGPTTASVPADGTFAFTSAGNVFSVSDAYMAGETVTLTVTAGTLNATAGSATVTGNGSNSMSISGTLADVNTVLGTLAFTAPSSGPDPTLTVQADDGSATSAVLTTAISLTNIATSITISPATGTFGGSTTLSAVLTASGTPLANETVTFSLNGSPVGTATTDSSGTATVSGVSLAGINAGTYVAYAVRQLCGRRHVSAQ